MWCTPIPCPLAYWLLWEAIINTTTIATGQCCSQCIIVFTVLESYVFLTKESCPILCCRQCFALCFMNSAYSFFACLVVSSVTGFMAYNQNLAIEDVATAGELIPHFSPLSFFWHFHYQLLVIPLWNCWSKLLKQQCPQDGILWPDTVKRLLFQSSNLCISSIIKECSKYTYSHFFSFNLIFLI